MQSNMTNRITPVIKLKATGSTFSKTIEPAIKNLRASSLSSGTGSVESRVKNTKYRG